MMSPGQASSTISRSRAKNRIGELTDSTLPVPICVSFMPRRNLPLHSRRKAMRSRWLGSMLAWTLKTKPATLGSVGSIGRGSAGCGRGGGAHQLDFLGKLLVGDAVVLDHLADAGAIARIEHQHAVAREVVGAPET